MILCCVNVVFAVYLQKCGIYTQKKKKNIIFFFIFKYKAFHYSIHDKAFVNTHIKELTFKKDSNALSPSSNTFIAYVSKKVLSLFILNNSRQVTCLKTRF